MVLFSAEKMYQTLKTVFEHISKHLEVCLFSVSGNVVKHCLSCLLVLLITYYYSYSYYDMLLFFLIFFFCFTIDVHVAGFLAKDNFKSPKPGPISIYF